METFNDSCEEKKHTATEEDVLQHEAVVADDVEAQKEEDTICEECDGEEADPGDFPEDVIQIIMDRADANMFPLLPPEHSANPADAKDVLTFLNKDSHAKRESYIWQRRAAARATAILDEGTSEALWNARWAYTA